jgi:hypothetical protein
MGYLDASGNYYEGDRQGADVGVPARPSQFHEWMGGAWTYFQPVPQVVTRFQARAALLQSDFLEEVEAVMSHEDTDAMAKLAWTDAQEFYRQSPTILGMAGVIGLTDKELDELFILAATIQA